MSNPIATAPSDATEKPTSDFQSYLAILRAAVQSKMEYRGSFVAYIFTLIGFYGAQVSVIALMLTRPPCTTDTGDRGK